MSAASETEGECDSMAERSQRLNALQNGAIGSLSGMIEVMLQQPTIAMKNAVQVCVSICRSLCVRGST